MVLPSATSNGYLLRHAVHDPDAIHADDAVIVKKQTAETQDAARDE